MQLIDNIIRNTVNLANALADEGIATFSTPRRSSRMRRTRRIQRAPSSDSDDANISLVNNARSIPPTLVQLMGFARHIDLPHERSALMRGPSPSILNMTPNLLDMQTQIRRERVDDSGDETEEFNFESFVRIIRKKKKKIKKSVSD